MITPRSFGLVQFMIMAALVHCALGIGIMAGRSFPFGNAETTAVRESVRRAAARDGVFATTMTTVTWPEKYRAPAGITFASTLDPNRAPIITGTLYTGTSSNGTTSIMEIGPGASWVTIPAVTAQPDDWTSHYTDGPPWRCTNGHCHVVDCSSNEDRDIKACR